MAKCGEEDEVEANLVFSSLLCALDPKSDEKKVAWRMQEGEEKMKTASGIKDKAETAERKLIFRRSIKRQQRFGASFSYAENHQPVNSFVIRTYGLWL